jgi:membrane-associated protease RseP (regulator of RpoE activity)
MLAIIIFIIILGVLIFVHEFGHFVIARRNGIRAEEFGFGFPPRIFGVQYITGKKREKVAEIESIEIKTTDIISGKEEIIQETITEKIHRSTKKVAVGRWRII